MISINEFIYKKLSNSRIGNYQISIRASKLEQAEEIADIVVDLFSGLKEAPIRSCTLTGVNQGYYKEERLHGIHISLRFKLVDEHF